MAQQKDSRRFRQLEAIGKISPAVAHDVNNLLSGILGYSQILLADPAVEYLKPHIAEIEKAGKRIASLIRVLQVFGHKSFYRPETLNLNNVIQEMEKYFPLIMGPQIDFGSFKDPELWPVNIDLAYIRQALIALAIDIQDVLPQGGSVSLETKNFPAPPAPCQQEPDRQEHSVLMVLSATGTVVFEPIFSSSLEGDSSDTAAAMEMISETATAAEIIHFCRGRVSIIEREEHKLALQFSLPAAIEGSTR